LLLHRYFEQNLRIESASVSQANLLFFYPHKPHVFNLFLNQYLNHLLSEKRLHRAKSPKSSNKIGNGGPLDDFQALEGLSWKEITITFTTDESLRIQARQLRRRFTFAVIGFEDKRKGDLPDSRWQILCEDFAQNNGEVTIATQFTKFNLKAGVWEINKRLKELFNISDRPIFFDHRKTAYITKFLIRDEIQSPDRAKNYLR